MCLYAVPYLIKYDLHSHRFSNVITNNSGQAPTSLFPVFLDCILPYFAWNYLFHQSTVHMSMRHFLLHLTSYNRLQVSICLSLIWLVHVSQRCLQNIFCHASLPHEIVRHFNSKFFRILLKVHSQVWHNFWQLKALWKWWKTLLFHLKNSFRSQGS